MPARPTIARRAVISAGAALLAVFALAAPAAAHVTVASDDDTRGADDAILTFRVPNEEDNAVTVKVDIKFPSKNPIASVKPSPKPGWAITTKTVKFNPPIKTDDGTITEGVGEVIYTASSPANGIPIGGFEAFQVLVGPLPDAAEVAFPTVQTYSNGKVVSWIEPVTDPANPPENPTPILELAAASDAGSGDATAAPAPSPSASATAASVDLSGYATTSKANTGLYLGLAALVVGALGLAAGGIALARSRRKAG